LPPRKGKIANIERRDLGLTVRLHDDQILGRKTDKSLVDRRSGQSKPVNLFAFIQQRPRG
jgi:hypothetical protein